MATASPKMFCGLCIKGLNSSTIAYSLNCGHNCCSGCAIDIENPAVAKGCLLCAQKNLTSCGRCLGIAKVEDWSTFGLPCSHNQCIGCFVQKDSSKKKPCLMCKLKERSHVLKSPTERAATGDGQRRDASVDAHHRFQTLAEMTAGGSKDCDFGVLPTRDLSEATARGSRDGGLVVPRTRVASDSTAGGSRDSSLETPRKRVLSDSTAGGSRDVDSNEGPLRALLLSGPTTGGNKNVDDKLKHQRKRPNSGSTAGRNKDSGSKAGGSRGVSAKRGPRRNRRTSTSTAEESRNVALSLKNLPVPITSTSTGESRDVDLNLGVQRTPVISEQTAGEPREVGLNQGHQSTLLMSEQTAEGSRDVGLNQGHQSIPLISELPVIESRDVDLILEFQTVPLMTDPTVVESRDAGIIQGHQSIPLISEATAGGSKDVCLHPGLQRASATSAPTAGRTDAVVIDLGDYALVIDPIQTASWYVKSNTINQNPQTTSMHIAGLGMDMSTAEVAVGRAGASNVPSAGNNQGEQFQAGTSSRDVRSNVRTNEEQQNTFSIGPLQLPIDRCPQITGVNLDNLILATPTVPERENAGERGFDLLGGAVGTSTAQVGGGVGSGASSSVEPELCRKHNAIFSYWCNYCREFLCWSCDLSKHKCLGQMNSRATFSLVVSDLSHEWTKTMWELQSQSRNFDAAAEAAVQEIVAIEALSGELAAFKQKIDLLVSALNTTQVDVSKRLGKFPKVPTETAVSVEPCSVRRKFVAELTRLRKPPTVQCVDSREALLCRIALALMGCQDEGTFLRNFTSYPAAALQNPKVAIDGLFPSVATDTGRSYFPEEKWVVTNDMEYQAATHALANHSNPLAVLVVATGNHREDLLLRLLSALSSKGCELKLRFLDSFYRGEEYEKDETRLRAALGNNWKNVSFAGPRLTELFGYLSESLLRNLPCLVTSLGQRLNDILEASLLVRMVPAVVPALSSNQQRLQLHVSMPLTGLRNVGGGEVEDGDHHELYDLAFHFSTLRDPDVESLLHLWQLTYKFLLCPASLHLHDCQLSPVGAADLARRLSALSACQSPVTPPRCIYIDCSHPVSHPVSVQAALGGVCDCDVHWNDHVIGTVWDVPVYCRE